MTKKNLADAKQHLRVEVRHLDTTARQLLDALDKELGNAVLRGNAYARPVALKLELPRLVLGLGIRRHADRGRPSCTRDGRLEVTAPVQRLLRADRFISA